MTERPFAVFSEGTFSCGSDSGLRVFKTTSSDTEELAALVLTPRQWRFLAKEALRVADEIEANGRH